MRDTSVRRARLTIPLWLAIAAGMVIGALTIATIRSYRLGGFDDLFVSVLISLWSAESLAGLIIGAFLGSFCPSPECEIMYAPRRSAGTLNREPRTVNPEP